MRASSSVPSPAGTRTSIASPTSRAAAVRRRRVLRMMRTSGTSSRYCHLACSAVAICVVVRVHFVTFRHTFEVAITGSEESKATSARCLQHPSELAAAARRRFCGHLATCTAATRVVARLHSVTFGHTLMAPGRAGCIPPGCGGRRSRPWLHAVPWHRTGQPGGRRGRRLRPPVIVGATSKPGPSHPRTPWPRLPGPACRGPPPRSSCAPRRWSARR